MKKFTIILLLAFVVVFTTNSIAQQIAVKGRVSDNKGISLPGVSIRIKNGQGATQADQNGNYSINAPSNGTLVFSFIGFQVLEVPVNGRTQINVQLQDATQELQQVVVVGYGTQRKVDVTGSVAQVKGGDISKQVSTDAASSLQGKVAGVQITNSGSPGGTPKVVIRGVGTIYGNTNLLYVVDGMWYDNISFLNPSDIESMSILKDASAQSIYGIRAANGVILVTTKKGSKNRTVIDYTGTAGLQSLSNEVEMANGNEYATIINELYTSNGKAALFNNPQSFGAGTNWYDAALRTAFITNHQLSINGGGEKSTYNFSLGYLNQEGLVKGNNYRRYTARFNNDYTLSDKFKAGFNITGVYNDSTDVPGGIWHELYSSAPVVPVYNPDGSYGDPYAFSLGSAVQFNPMATLAAYNVKGKRYRATGNAYASYEILKGLTFKTSFGGDFGEMEYRNYVGAYNYTQAQKNTTTKLTMGRVNTRNWIIENTLTYDKKLNDHNVTLLVGQSAQRYKSYTSRASGEGVPYDSEDDLYLKLATTGTVLYTDGGSLSTTASYFGRANYNYKNTYLLNASLRADGFSQFYGGGNLWGYFPSVGLGWVVTNEPFMKNQHLFNNLKLRGSWGKVGNAGVPINPTIVTVNNAASLNAIFGANQNAYTGASISSIAYPTINWERIAGTNVGFEAALLNNKLSIEGDYYNKITEDAIFAIPVLRSLGLTSSGVVSNQASFRNRGAELSVNWRNTTENGLTYSVGANVGMNVNKVTKVTSGSNPILTGATGITNGAVVTRTVQGRPIAEFYGYEVAGIFQNTSEVASSAQPTAAPGDFRYVDQNSDGLIDGRDRTSIGNPNPKYNYGINTNFGYKNFDLSLDFQGVADVDVYNANIAYRFGNENFTKDFYNNRWHGEGTSTTYPSANVGSTTNSAPSSFYVESGAYFRVRNVQLGYTFPKSIASRLKMSRLRVYANAQNPINIFGYKGFSPEVSGASVLTSGVDANVYPLYSTYNFGLNVTF
ncbi:SusC/RagA family TonB-linked outer membrane protein [Desertivirga arenae]|uniref:SusC/RagA family TonB-linked outer membrane protein n=1 Tax=Desertivirga arenae TaxID=2810309 RepID=UPI001A96F2BC|nr:TonB-dependent receptor [Pedobacter sp. SYSU D00823]